MAEAVIRDWLTLPTLDCIFAGVWRKTTGDGFLAVFDSATRAVRCGAAMARSACKMERPIRVGVTRAKSGSLVMMPEGLPSMRRAPTI